MKTLEGRIRYTSALGKLSSSKRLRLLECDGSPAKYLLPLALQDQQSKNPKLPELKLSAAEHNKRDNAKSALFFVPEQDSAL